MDLNTLRNEIDSIDTEILNLFLKRMDVCRKVGEYKKSNNLPVMQGNRENEIIERIKANSPNGLEDGSALLFQNIMDISKSLQNIEMISSCDKKYDGCNFDSATKIACQGTVGSYSEKACKKLFQNKTVEFYRDFEDVFNAVDKGEVDFGILPLQNTTIGSVSETYDLMAKYDFYINTLIRVEITHCLAVKKGTTISEIEGVYSKEEALSQCTNFLKRNNLIQIPYANTALSSELVANSNEKIACICSKNCAELYGLEIVADNIANAYPNYPRFICFSKNLTTNENADII